MFDYFKLKRTRCFATHGDIRRSVFHVQTAIFGKYEISRSVSSQCDHVPLTGGAARAVVGDVDGRGRDESRGWKRAGRQGFVVSLVAPSTTSAILA